MNGLYFVRINWYDDYSDEDKISCAFIVAPSYAEAVNRMASDFQYINSITIDEVQPADYCDINCVYVPDNQEIINAIREENNF